MLRFAFKTKRAVYKLPLNSAGRSAPWLERAASLWWIDSISHGPLTVPSIAPSTWTTRCVSEKTSLLPQHHLQVHVTLWNQRLDRISVHGLIWQFNVALKPTWQNYCTDSDSYFQVDKSRIFIVWSTKRWITLRSCLYNGFCLAIPFEFWALLFHRSRCLLQLYYL